MTVLCHYNEVTLKLFCIKNIVSLNASGCNMFWFSALKNNSIHLEMSLSYRHDVVQLDTTLQKALLQFIIEHRAPENFKA
jgi:hypothetical protein